MTDEAYKELTIKHDKSIDLLANSISSLADSVGATNKKIDDLLAVVSRQNVLSEKFDNLEENLKESFNRVHNKTREIERHQNVDGCPILKVEVEKIKVANNRISDIESTLTWVVRLIIGTLITGAFSTAIIILKDL